MRRLDGVDHVQLDTEEQFALISLGSPTPIAFPKMVKAADSAAFETVGIRLDAEGTIVEGQCLECSTSHAFLRLDGTGQEFPLEGAQTATGKKIEVSAKVVDWEGEHPVLRIE